MRAIWKFDVGTPPVEAVTISIPEGSVFRFFGVQSDDSSVTYNAWFEVDTQAKKVQRTFIIVGTGRFVTVSDVYLGTVQYPPFVWHLYEVARP